MKNMNFKNHYMGLNFAGIPNSIGVSPSMMKTLFSNLTI
jgi:hypothetical protein